jgi:heme A synthase
VYLVLAAALITAVWGLILYFTKREVPKVWRTVLIITGCLALLQGLFGVSLVALGQRPGRPDDSLYYLHYVYGGIVALGLPVALTYATGGKNPRRDMLIFSIALLVIFAAGIRALMTGPH